LKKVLYKGGIYMSFYGRFFKPEEKMTFRKVLDRVGVFTAVECKAYIESSRQALYQLHKSEVDGKLVFDKKENQRIDEDHQPLIDYIDEVISRQGKSTEGDIQAWNDLICIRDYIVQDILSVYQPDGYGSNNYDDMKVMDILLSDDSKNLTMWPNMKWASEWNPSVREYRKLYDKYVDLHWKLIEDSDSYDSNMTVKKFESQNRRLVAS
tara:strand:- start:78 stop:704 length:627 start_codon:yes stop_codon:yes gene_type:complete